MKHLLEKLSLEARWLNIWNMLKQECYAMLCFNLETNLNDLSFSKHQSLSLQHKKNIARKCAYSKIFIRP